LLLTWEKQTLIDKSYWQKAIVKDKRLERAGGEKIVIIFSTGWAGRRWNGGKERRGGMTWCCWVGGCLKSLDRQVLNTMTFYTEVNEEHSKEVHNCLAA
jgi:hypothetical protein